MVFKLRDYQLIPFPKSRHLIVDSLYPTKYMHIVHIITEVDITKARQKVYQYNINSGETLSLSPFIISCLAQAVDENKRMHAYRKGNKLILFDDVDICVIIEREIAGEKVPLFPHVVRAANKKTLQEILHEIKAARLEDLNETIRTKRIAQYLLFPAFIRNLFWQILFNSVHWRKRVAGTVGVTSLGMFMKGSSWLIPSAPYTLNISVGGISEKPRNFSGNIETRELLSITVSFNHDIIDGAYAARFTERLKGLIESGYGLG